MRGDVDHTLREPDEDKVSSDGTKTEEDDQDDPPLVSSQDVLGRSSPTTY